MKEEVGRVIIIIIIMLVRFLWGPPWERYALFCGRRQRLSAQLVVSDEGWRTLDLVLNFFFLNCGFSCWLNVFLKLRKMVWYLNRIWCSFFVWKCDYFVLENVRFVWNFRNLCYFLIICCRLICKSIYDNLFFNLYKLIS